MFWSPCGADRSDRKERGRVREIRRPYRPIALRRVPLKDSRRRGYEGQDDDAGAGRIPCDHRGVLNTQYLMASGSIADATKHAGFGWGGHGAPFI